MTGHCHSVRAVFPGPRILGFILCAGIVLAALTEWAMLSSVPTTGLTKIFTPVEGDYVNFWAAGTLVRLGHGALLSDLDGYHAWLRQAISPAIAFHAWSYPPPALFLAEPLSWLPLAGGFALWGLLTSALAGWALRAAGAPPRACLALLVSPAVLANFGNGQTGALAAALLLAGLALAERRPLLAGLCLGALVLKPQLALLAPVCLLARRQGKVVLVAGTVAVAVCAASWAVFGTAIWRGFLAVNAPLSHELLERPFLGQAFQLMLTTVFSTLRAQGASLATAWSLQAGVTLGCVGLCWRLWRTPAVPPDLRLAGALALAPLATPYAFYYDLVGTAAAVALLATRARREGCSRLELATGLAILGTVWIWPAVYLVVNALAAPFLGPVLQMALVGVIWRQVRRVAGSVAQPPR